MSLVGLLERGNVEPESGNDTIGSSNNGGVLTAMSLLGFSIWTFLKRKKNDNGRQSGNPRLHAREWKVAGGETMIANKF
jgi:hypothetical protein